MSTPDLQGISQTIIRGLDYNGRAGLPSHVPYCTMEVKLGVASCSRISLNVSTGGLFTSGQMVTVGWWKACTSSSDRTMTI